MRKRKLNEAVQHLQQTPSTARTPSCVGPPARTGGAIGAKVWWHSIGGAWKAFGLSRELFVAAVRRPIFTTFMRTAMLADHLFFPGIRRQTIDRPVFVIGHPRSGTTFVHRLLTQTREFSVFELWELLCPSLTVRKLAWPIVKRIISRGKGTMVSQEAGHRSRLDDIEEEEMLFFHTGNTQFMMAITPLAFSDWDPADIVWSDQQPPSVRRRAMRFLRACLTRQLVATQTDRMVAKTVFSGMRMRTLLEEFPDAKFVYIIRSPLETIPSHLTLDRNVFDHQWGLDRIPEALLERYFQRRYQHNVELYRYCEQVLESGTIPADQLLVVTYPQLQESLAETMQKVIDFTELSCSPELLRLIEEQSQAQSDYRRSHQNLDLETFGLTTEQVVRDLAPLFEKYGFRRSSA